MGIQLVVAGLTYFALLVLTFGLTQLLKLEEDRCEEIVNKAFNNYLILASKFISLISLGSSLYVLTR